MAMRIAIVSDIHGNRTAFAAVLADVREMSPDLILQGGDLADGGSSPAEIVDQVRDLGWPGVLGNTDEMHTRPASLEEFAGRSKAPAALWAAVREMASATRERLGEARIAWLSTLPASWVGQSVLLVHASPASLWHAPPPEASDAELAEAYGGSGESLVVYGHVHRPFIRRVAHAGGGTLTVVNSGTAGMPYDGDPRASYVLLDDLSPRIRRVAYDVEREVRLLADSGIPHHDWTARMLRAASPQMP